MVRMDLFHPLSKENRICSIFGTSSSGSAAEALESYRMRWQIELVFKRLKTLSDLGTSKRDD
jgi:hypothetical protein